jgi:hypothetical protein
VGEDVRYVNGRSEYKVTPDQLTVQSISTTEKKGAVELKLEERVMHNKLNLVQNSLYRYSIDMV